MSQFDDVHGAIMEAVQAGVSIEDASRSVDVPVATVRRWLRDGRKGRDPYAAFTRAIDGARADRKAAERALEGALTPDEAELLLAKAARKGSVSALRLWFERRAAEDASRRGEGAQEALERVFDERAT